MNSTKTLLTTPSPKNNLVKSNSNTQKNDRPGLVFVSLALDMSWRLAIVVLVPIVGGFELDKKLHSSPLLTIVGFVLAMVGMGLVMYRTLQVVNGVSQAPKEKKK